MGHTSSQDEVEDTLRSSPLRSSLADTKFPGEEINTALTSNKGNFPALI